MKRRESIFPKSMVAKHFTSAASSKANTPKPCLWGESNEQNAISEYLESSNHNGMSVQACAEWERLLVYDKKMPTRCLQFVNTGLVKSQTYLQYQDSTGHISSIIKADQPPFLRGREGAGGDAHILRGRTLIRISCPDWSNSVRTPRDVRYSCALIGLTAVTYTS